MKIIYLHHSERDTDWSLPNIQHKLTKRGEVLAELVAQSFEGVKIEKIYTPSFKRHVHTAEILNKVLQTEIVIEPRFNELGNGVKVKETLPEFLKRNIDAIEEICKKYEGTDKNIVCISSGINLTAFMLHYYNLPYADITKLIQHTLIAPVIFEYN